MKKNLLKKIIAGTVITTTLFGSTVYASNTWVSNNGKWNLVNEQGVKTTGWQSANGYWYYLNDNGIMSTGWNQIGGVWYYLKDNGAMATGWLSNGGHWYYLNNNGSMATGWLSNGGCWYYLNSDGIMATGWKHLGDNWYYLKPNGTMALNTTIQGYYLNGSGIWTNVETTNKLGSDQEITDQWRAKYNQNKYHGLAFNRFEDVLNVYAKGKVAKNEIRGVDEGGYDIGPKDPTGLIYSCTKNPYDLGHKEWYEEGICYNHNWQLTRDLGIECNKVTVSGNTLEEIYSSAKANGVYAEDYSETTITGAVYDEVVINKDTTTGKYNVARLRVVVYTTLPLDNDSYEPGYLFP